MTGIVHDLRRAVLRDGAGHSDSELLDLFLRERDETALAALVHRHAAMVWGVCRRILTSHHDAEDAFQATFLVLVRKAAVIQRKELLASWLYGVAQQTAIRARALAAKKGQRERQVTTMPESAAVERDLWDSVQPLLDQELSRLPEKYRALVILCDLEGKTRKEAAQELDCPEGTVAGRLARARAMLAKRLAGRGITVSAGALASLLTTQAASASVPPTIVSATIHATTLIAAGHTAAAAISTNAIALSEGVLKAMFLSKLKMTAAILVLLGAFLVGGGTIARQALANDGAERQAPDATAAIQALVPEAQGQRPQPKDIVTVAGKLESIDASSVTIGYFKRGEGAVSKTYTLAKDIKISRDGKDAKLADLKKGVQVSLKLSADQKSAVAITFDTPAVSAPLKSVDANKNTITVTVGPRGAKEDKTYDVAKDAKIVIDGKESKLADLRTGGVIAFAVNDTNAVTLIRTSTRKDRNPDEQ
jgi:RNA polymerase sigma factor (sigma-70 family)